MSRNGSDQLNGLKIIFWLFCTFKIITLYRNPDFNNGISNSLCAKNKKIIQKPIKQLNIIVLTARGCV